MLSFLGTNPKQRALLAVLALALIVRVAAIVARGEYLPPRYVGAEAGAIAHALAADQRFSTPFGGGSPSTHLPPAYPFFLATLISIQDAFALPGHAPATWPPPLFRRDTSVFYVALLINLLASCLLPVLTMRLAEAAKFPRAVGLIAAVAICLCPEALRAVGLIWDEAVFVTLAAATLLWLLRRTAAGGLDTRAAAVLGLLNGLLTLLNPAMVLAIPAAFVAGARAAGQAWRKVAALAFVLAAMTLAGGLPWHVRNWLILDPPARVFIRGNFWLEVWSSMNPVTFIHGRPRVVHPWKENGTERLEREGVAITEQQYFAYCRDRVLESGVLGDPPALAQHVARQFDAFWFGPAEAARWGKSRVLFFLAQGLPTILGVIGWIIARLRSRSAPAVEALLMTLVVFPLPYYLSGGGARYRHPIDVVIYLGMAWTLWSLWALVSPGRAASSESPAPLTPAGGGSSGTPSA